eukprot:TRINITY_DN65647_c0_g1_i1.p1 TRINITY_DN65647_c0_g1~~TRINITY_DN65647_c0_g1_i1.p1  ORF type:complete len:234 (+),score=25.40 TRINITY_DN65647_c0_g1_i1:100-801(+)
MDGIVHSQGGDAASSEGGKTRSTAAAKGNASKKVRVQKEAKLVGSIKMTEQNASYAEATKGKKRHDRGPPFMCTNLGLINGLVTEHKSEFGAKTWQTLKNHHWDTIRTDAMAGNLRDSVAVQDQQSLRQRYGPTNHSAVAASSRSSRFVGKGAGRTRLDTHVRSRSAVAHGGRTPGIVGSNRGVTRTRAVSEKRKEYLEVARFLHAKNVFPRPHAWNVGFNNARLKQLASRSV